MSTRRVIHNRARGAGRGSSEKEPLGVRVHQGEQIKGAGCGTRDGEG